MTQPLSLIIFDCDGTLVDSKALIVAAMQRAFEAVELTPPAPEEITRIVGLSLHHAIEALGVENNPATIAAIGEGYKAAYTHLRDVMGTDEPLFPGIAELVTDLGKQQHNLLGIATGKSMKGVNTLLQRHNWHGLFQTIQTADNAPSKPAPGMITNALKETGVDPARTLMIGDTSFDMAMAKSAGISAIGVSWGHHKPEELSAHGATRIVDDVPGLETAIQQVLKS